MFQCAVSGIGNRGIIHELVGSVRGTKDASIFSRVRNSERIAACLEVARSISNRSISHDY